VVSVAAELADVHAGAERAARAGEQDGVDAVVGGRGLQRLGEREAQRDRQRVALLGPVEREDRDRAVALGPQRSLVAQSPNTRRALSSR
jgi:hypothetical protein